MRARLGGRLDDVGRDAVAAVAVLVGWADGDQGDVDDDPSRAEQPRNLREEDRCVVSAPFVDRLADVRTDEIGVVPEPVAQPRLGVGRDPESENVDDLGVAEVAALGQCLDQGLRFSGPRADEHSVAGLDSRHRALRAHDLRCVALSPVDAHCGSSFGRSVLRDSPDDPLAPREITRGWATGCRDGRREDQRRPSSPRRPRWRPGCLRDGARRPA